MRTALRLAVAVAALALPASAFASSPVQIRKVDLDGYPQVRVTAVVPGGTRPALTEAGKSPQFVRVRQLGTDEAMMLAVDNSHSMRGEPLREARNAAEAFLAREHGAAATGLVSFGHEALALTRPGESSHDVAQTLAALQPDLQGGTSLYDAVRLSVSRLQGMSSGTRILVLLTDGRDLGSRSSLGDAIAAAKHGNVVVYAIAAGSQADRSPLQAIASATGGRVFAATDAASLGATYRALGRELARTWQISYLTSARPGDRLPLGVHAAGQRSSAPLHIPGGQYGSRSGVARLAHSPMTAGAVVLLVAVLLASAGIAANRRLRKSEIGRLVDQHVKVGKRREEDAAKARRFDSLFDWTEHSLEGLPGSDRLAQQVERSGIRLRVGHVPYLGLIAAFVLGVLVTIANAGPLLTILFMLIGLALPIITLRIAAGRRAKAFDRQLPDVLATIASTLRAGHGLRPAIRGIADDGTPPASEEFGRVLGEERLGRPLDQALAAMCERIASDDLEYVATAVSVQSQVGGSLAGLFDTLSETVRERQRHARKVRALTSMGRMSAAVLISLPIGLTALLTMISSSYMAPLFTTSAGHVLIAICLGSMTIGSLILKRIITVEY